MTALLPPVVEVRDVAFSYGDLEIFRGLSLSIARGKVVAILGGSGVGKSTLLKLIGGQLRPTAGRGIVGGAGVHPLSSAGPYRFRPGICMIVPTSGAFT